METAVDGDFMHAQRNSDCVLFCVGLKTSVVGMNSSRSKYGDLQAVIFRSTGLRDLRWTHGANLHQLITKTRRHEDSHKNMEDLRVFVVKTESCAHEKS